LSGRQTWDIFYHRPLLQLSQVLGNRDYGFFEVPAPVPGAPVLAGPRSTAAFVNKCISTRRGNACGVPEDDVSPAEVFCIAGLAAAKPAANIRISGTLFLSAKYR
jgi:hypothetical protein